MSALLNQLQQVLAPWDGLAPDGFTASGGNLEKVCTARARRLKGSAKAKMDRPSGISRIKPSDTTASIASRPGHKRDAAIDRFRNLVSFLEEGLPFPGDSTNLSSASKPAHSFSAGHSFLETTQPLVGDSPEKRPSPAPIQELSPELLTGSLECPLAAGLESVTKGPSSMTAETQRGSVTWGDFERSSVSPSLGAHLLETSLLQHSEFLVSPTRFRTEPREASSGMKGPDSDRKRSPSDSTHWTPPSLSSRHSLPSQSAETAPPSAEMRSSSPTPPVREPSQVEGVLYSSGIFRAPHLTDGTSSLPTRAESTDFSLNESEGGLGKTQELEETGMSLTKLELSRSCLALFLSNAGCFRPVLQKPLAFLFEYIDFLEGERYQLLEYLRRQSSQQIDGFLPRDEGGSVETADCYHKVRLVEKKMSELVEEASLQRDRFKAQIEAERQEKLRLQVLLSHQFELTHMLYEYVDAKGMPLFTIDPDSGKPSGVPGKHVDYVKKLISDAEKEFVLEETQKALLKTQQELRQLQERNQNLSRVNGKYARQAVELAARLSIITDHNHHLAADVQLYQRDLVKAQMMYEKLWKDLMTARSMILVLLELRAAAAAVKRRSKEHRPSLSLLAAKEASRESLSLSRPLSGQTAATTTAAAGQAGAAGSVPTSKASRRRSSPLHHKSKPVVPRQAAKKPMRGRRRSSKLQINTLPIPTPESSQLQSPEGTSSVFAAEGPSSARSHDGEGELVSFKQLNESQSSQSFGETPPPLTSQVLETRVRGMLATADGFGAETAKTSLIRILKRQHDGGEADQHVFLRVGMMGAAGGGEGVAGASPPFTSPLATLSSPVPFSPFHAHEEMTPSAFAQRLWAPPFGCTPQVPSHLRSASPVSIFVLHPLVMECLVYELLSQRVEWVDRASREAAGGSPVLLRGTASPSSPPPPPPTKMDFDKYVQLFIHVVWLSEEDSFLLHLPENVQQEIQRAEKRACHTEVQKVGEAEGENGKEERKTMNVPPSFEFSQSTLKEDEQETVKRLDGFNLANANSILTPVMQARLYCLFNTVSFPESALKLPEEGLRLAYSLEVASQHPDAGFLSVLYGYLSRRQIGEVTLYILRRDREIFLKLCRLVDQERENQRREEFEAAKREVLQERGEEYLFALREAKGSSPKAGEEDSPPLMTEQERLEEKEAIQSKYLQWSLRGCIPLVSLAHILMIMYPCYPIRRVEQLILAALEDATDSHESPEMVYYALLLPERMLPGGSSMPNDDSSSLCGSAFASLFYIAIMEDILASLQSIEDSMVSSAPKPLPLTSASNPMVTAKQLVSMSVGGLTSADQGRWGNAVSQLWYAWPRLRPAWSTKDASLAGPPRNFDASLSKLEAGSSSFRSPNPYMDDFNLASPHSPHRPLGSPVGSPTEYGSFAGSFFSAASGDVPTVPLQDAVVFLRQHFAPRRGPHSVPVVSGHDARVRASLTSRLSPNVETLETHRELELLDLSLSTNREEVELERLMTEEAQEATWGVCGWGAAHYQFSRTMLKRWVKNGSNSYPLLSIPAIAAELKKIDQDRSKPWASEVVGPHNSHVQWMNPQDKWLVVPGEPDELPEVPPVNIAKKKEEATEKQCREAPLRRRSRARKRRM